MNCTPAIEALDAIITGGVVGPFRRYESRTNSPESRWASVGILKKQKEEEGRVVLELLCHVDIPDVVVRVYDESPLRIYYARRSEVIARIAQMARQALTIYENVPGDADEDPGAELRAFGIDFGDALNPLPPPFSCEEIPRDD